ncbi:Hsp20/alpha crystallin family protein [Halomarina halobia]|uniref:Hsp20/alpha crystallin family protein n=1 Tax=Halomarina halobia TaxID=3033386 RepID=A0ABD6AB39_9EURY|nr:Hsp20/alpha crystallin family protein [Halomarina sp. PSR21]
MLKDLSERVESVVLDGVGKFSSRVQERTPLSVDLLESEDAYLAVFDAPGATGEDVDVRFDQNTVRVRIDRFRDYYENYEMRIPGRGLSLDASVALPESVDVDPRAAEATLASNGTLRVRIPKSGRGRDVAVSTEEEVEGANADTNVDVSAGANREGGEATGSDAAEGSAATDVHSDAPGADVEGDGPDGGEDEDDERGA